MKAPKIDLSKLEATIKVGDMLIANAQTDLEKSFFTIINNFYRSCLTVKDEGKIIVSHSIYAPVELLYGFDNIFPLSYHMYSIIMTNRLEMHELIYGAASAVGVSPDICGGHVSIPGVAVKGWIPKPDFILWDYGPCDNSAQAGEFLMEVFGVPGYFIDRPYRYVEEEITYYTRQYRELVRILEELAGRNIDWEKVKDRMRLTLEMAKVRKEFIDLRHAKPSPASVGVGVNHFLIAGLVAGSTEEGLEYYKMIRDEWASLVKQGKGYAPEKYRMLFVGLPDLYVDAFDTWMQLEHGISVVAGPTINFREYWEPDPSGIIDKQARPDPIKLLESLARSYRVHV